MALFALNEREKTVIRDTEFWEAWEKEQIRREPVDYARNLRIADAMYEQARARGVLPLSDPLEGLDDKIRVAKALNVRLPTPEARQRP